MAQRTANAWRLGFAGSPDFAAIVLQALAASNHEVAIAFTQPDRRAGRGRKLTACPARRQAESLGIPVRTPGGLDAELDTLADLDCLVVAAYGLLLSPAVLAAPRHGCINVHASLLPRWRGAAPVERAIMAGDTATGVSIMQMDPGLDTGPVYTRRSLAIGDTGGDALTLELAELGAAALLDTLATLPEPPAAPQCDSEATLAPKLTAADAIIDWRQAAESIARQVQALTGRMPAFATQTDDRGKLRLRILSARAHPGTAKGAPGTLVQHDASWRIICGGGELELTKVQLNRGKGTPLAAADAARGYPSVFTPGATFDVANDAVKDQPLAGCGSARADRSAPE